MEEKEYSALAKSIEAAIESVLDEHGFQGYKIESIAFDKKSIEFMGPGGELECKVVGFPPRIECKVSAG